MSQNKDRQRAIAVAIEILSTLESEWPQVDRNLTQWAHGLRSSSGDRGPKGSYSNPTAAAALMRDKFGRQRADAYRWVDSIYSAAVNLDMVRREAVDPPVPPTPEERGLASCCNLHGCPEDAWGYKAGRCQACYDYHRRTGRDRRAVGHQPEDLT